MADDLPFRLGCGVPRMHITVALSAANGVAVQTCLTVSVGNRLARDTAGLLNQTGDGMGSELSVWAMEPPVSGGRIRSTPTRARCSPDTGHSLEWSKLQQGSKVSTVARWLRGTIRQVAGGTAGNVCAVDRSTWSAGVLAATRSCATRVRSRSLVPQDHMHRLIRSVRGVSKCCAAQARALTTAQASSGIDSPYRPFRMQPQRTMSTDPSHHAVLADSAILDHPCIGKSEDTQALIDRILNRAGGPQCG